MPQTLFSLNEHVWTEISRHLDQHTLSQAALTCRAGHRTILPHLYADVTLYSEAGVTKFCAAVKANTALGPLVKALWVRLFSNGREQKPAGTRHAVSASLALALPKLSCLIHFTWSSKFHAIGGHALAALGQTPVKTFGLGMLPRKALFGGKRTLTSMMAWPGNLTELVFMDTCIAAGDLTSLVVKSQNTLQRLTLDGVTLPKADTDGVVPSRIFFRNFQDRSFPALQELSLVRIVPKDGAVSEFGVEALLRGPRLRRVELSAIRCGFKEAETFEGFASQNLAGLETLIVTYDSYGYDWTGIGQVIEKCTNLRRLELCDMVIAWQRLYYPTGYLELVASLRKDKRIAKKLEHLVWGVWWLDAQAMRELARACPRLRSLGFVINPTIVEKDKFFARVLAAFGGSKLERLTIRLHVSTIFYLSTTCPVWAWSDVRADEQEHRRAIEELAVEMPCLKEIVIEGIPPRKGPEDFENFHGIMHSGGQQFSEARTYLMRRGRSGRLRKVDILHTRCEPHVIGAFIDGDASPFGAAEGGYGRLPEGCPRAKLASTQRGAAPGSPAAGNTINIVRAQISFLLGTVTEESYAKNEREIESLIQQHGSEAHVHLIRRLISSALPAPGRAAAQPQSPTTVNPALALKLLVAETKRVARDPLLTPRLREAILGGLYDPTNGPTGNEPFRQLDFVEYVREKVQLAPLELFVVCQEVVQILVQGPPHLAGTKVPVKQAGVTKDVGLAAAQLLREVWRPALDVLSNPRAGEQGPSPEALNDLGPIQVSKLFEFLLSDYYIDFSTGEAGVAQTESAERLITVEQQRDLIRAFANRFNSVDLVSQITAHAVESFQCSPGTSATLIVHRLCPDPTFCTAELARAVLSKYDRLANAPPEEAAARATASLVDLVAAATAYGEHLGVDVLAWTQAVNSLTGGLRWGEVIHGLDNTQAQLPENWGLRVLAAVLAAEAPDAAAGLWGRWNNPDRQLALIERLTYLPNELLVAALKPNDDVAAVALDQVADAAAPIKQSAQAALESPWNNLMLAYTLLQLSQAAIREYSAVDTVKGVLERGIQQSPDLILIALVATPKPWSALHYELFNRLLSAFLAGQAGFQLVFHRISQLDSGLLLGALRDFYTENELNVTRVVDIAQELGIVEQLLDFKPIVIALDIAALASRRELLHLDNWLQSSCQTHGPPFIRAILDFLGVKVRYELDRTEKQDLPPATMVLLPGQIVASFMRVARINSDSFTQEDTEIFKDVRQAALQLHPRLMNFSPVNTEGREPGTFYQTFSSDIESEGDVLFRQLYDGEASVEDVINLLQRARESQDPRSVSFFSYVLSALYEEKRFFSTYPEKELTLTAHLFGSLIQNNMIEHIPLGIAVRYILDALKSPPDSSWFRFGVQALARFHERLHEWPQFAQAIASISHLQHTQPEVLSWARQALSMPVEDEPVAVQQAAAAAQANGDVERLIFTALSPDPPAEGQSTQEPDEDTADRIGFIFNNLSVQNLQDKSKELGEKLTDDITGWAGKYMVEQRIAIEPNNHKLYIDLLDQLARPALVTRILHETFIKSSVLLNAEKTSVNSTERSVLKNLGMWLGAMTLAKNKPILQRNASFKDLLLQGYDSNRLIVAIPFVCKVLEQGAQSRVFKPPNPWLMGILRLLVELYHYAEIKLNLKFEIEVLCKNLKVELKSLTPSTIIRERPSRAELEAAAAAARAASEAQHAQQMPHELHHLPLRPPSAEGAGYPAGDLQARSVAPPPLALGQQAGYAVSLADAITQALQALPGEMVFSPDVVGQFPPGRLQNLRNVVTIGIDRAIREIIAPVVERSVTIAGIATRELTNKDFAMEGDEDRLGKAAHLMVQNLAANLANVTCKDPLRISMLTNIRTMLVNNGLGEMLDDTRLGHLVQDNLEPACQIVEAVAKEKALLEVDDSLSTQYMARRKHRDRSNQPFWDSTAMAATHYSGMLPEALKIQLGGLQPSQLRVYDDFSRIRSGLPTVDGESPIPPFSRIAQQAAGRPFSPAAGTQAPNALQFSIAQVNGGIGELEGLLSQAAGDYITLAQLPPRHIVFTCMDSICNDASNSSQPEDSLRSASSKIVQMLYRAETPLAREAYVVILERLCMLSTNVVREVTGWFTYAEDERKLSVPVLMAVASRNLMDVGRFDGVLGALITREWRPTIIDFAAQFIARCLVSNPPVASREQLVQTLDALVQAAENGKATDLALELLEDLRGSASPPAAKPVQPEQNALRERLTAYFVDWVKLFQHSNNVDKAFVDFVSQLQTEGVLRGEEISSMFFRVCTEVSVEAYIKNKAAGAQAADMIFVPIDSLARLIALLVKYHADPNATQNDGSAAKVLYVNKVLSIVVLVLAHNHEEFGPHFQQKPFFRFFSSLLSNLHAIESYIGLSCYQSILNTLANQVQTLQPVYFPGFAFSWLSLVSHRLYMPRLLDGKWPEGQTLFNKHLMSMLRFLGPFLRTGEMQSTIKALYFGLLKVVLILLHDFPDYLSLYAPLLVQCTPIGCTQLVNILTSAFPSTAKLPDPFSEGIETSAEMSKAPATAPSALASMPGELKMALDKVMQNGSSATQLVGLANRFLLPEAAAGDLRYNYPLLDLLMQHLCVAAVGPTGKTAFAASSASVQVVEQLLRDLDVEGRYLVISSAANLLRWPSAHTRWGKQLLLHLYSTTDCKETVTRVLLERLLVARPHPWGIVWTMSALIRQNLVQEPFVTKHSEMAALVTKIQNSLTGGNATAAITNTTN